MPASTYDEYEQGWKAGLEYRKDRVNLNNAGYGWRGLTMVFLLYGLMAICAIASVAYQTGWGEMNHPFSEIIAGSGLLLLALTIPCWRRYQSAYERAEAAFNTKWARPVKAPTLPMKTTLDPVTMDDMKLLTMASVRLTASHPDLADELVRLKVRVQHLILKQEESA